MGCLQQGNSTRDRVATASWLSGRSHWLVAFDGLHRGHGCQGLHVREGCQRVDIEALLVLQLRLF